MNNLNWSHQVSTSKPWCNNSILMIGKILSIIVNWYILFSKIVQAYKKDNKFALFFHFSLQQLTLIIKNQPHSLLWLFFVFIILKVTHRTMKKHTTRENHWLDLNFYFVVIQHMILKLTSLRYIKYSYLGKSFNMFKLFFDKNSLSFWICNCF